MVTVATSTCKWVVGLPVPERQDFGATGQRAADTIDCGAAHVTGARCRLILAPLLRSEGGSAANSSDFATVTLDDSASHAAGINLGEQPGMVYVSRPRAVPSICGRTVETASGP